MIKEIKKYEADHKEKFEAQEKASIEEIVKLREELKNEREEFEKEVRKFQEAKKEIQQLAKKAKEKIRLNVGGTLFVTSRDTLLSVEDTLFCHLLGLSYYYIHIIFLIYLWSFNLAYYFFYFIFFIILIFLFLFLFTRLFNLLIFS